MVPTYLENPLILFIFFRREYVWYASKSGIVDNLTGFLTFSDLLKL